MASTINKNESATANPQRANRVATVFRRLAGNRLVVVATIFLLAFSLRLWHNSSLEHRVWYLEDAQNYLRSGNAIFRTVKESKSPEQLIDNISKDAKQYTGIYHAFDSDRLVDRMLTDGPIFPAYLAVIEAGSGLNPASPQYENITFKVSVANSLLDSATCVLLFLVGALLFGTLPGALAGVLYAIYPAAIVNTQWCMSETFCTFMLVSAVYALARFLTVPPQATVRRVLHGIATGAVLGVTALSRSAFPLVMPFFAIAAIFGMRSRKVENKLAAGLSLLSLAVAFLITVSPWLLYTQTALGQPRLTTNRLPAFNVISGNLSTIDGWTPYPNKLAFPEDMPIAISMVAADAKANTADFAILQMKKLPRLWSSVWNDCKYSVLGLNASAQTVYHQLMLYLALGWGFIICMRGKRDLSKGELIGTALVAGTIASHFIYLAFIALARYAFTAMPFVILAAAAAISYWVQAGKQARNRFAITSVAFCLVAAVTNEFRSLSSFVCGLVPQPWWLALAPWLTAATACLMYAGIWLITASIAHRFVHATSSEPTAKFSDKSGKPASSILSNGKNWLFALSLASFVIVSAGIAGSIVGSHTWSEWSTPLTDHQTIRQTIALPGQMGTLAPTGYVTMDIGSNEPLPLAQVELNGYSLQSQAIPIAMIQKDNESIVRSLAIQAKCMDQDYRTLRHWYAVPFPTSLLRKGQENTILVRNESKNSALTVYGDYVPHSNNAADGAQVLPSINSMSWNYAVEGSDYRVPMEQRPLEKIHVAGKTVQSTIENTTAAASVAETRKTSLPDLSPTPGHQWGNFRIRLLVQPLTERQVAKAAALAASVSSTPDNVSEDRIVFAQKAGDTHTAHGGDPTTFYLTDKNLPVSEALLSKHPIKFTCELKTEKRPVNAVINLVFKTGIGDVWKPDWQPDCIPVDAKSWKQVTIIDAFPKLLLEHGGVSTRPVLTPFSDDLLFNNQRKASKQSVQIRNAKLEFLDTTIPERKDLFAWKVY